MAFAPRGEGVRPRPLRHSVMCKADLWVEQLGNPHRFQEQATASMPPCLHLLHAAPHRRVCHDCITLPPIPVLALRHARQSPANVRAHRQRTRCEGPPVLPRCCTPSRCRRGRRRAAMTASPWACHPFASSRPRIDECTYDWCNCETRESAAFHRRTHHLQLVPRFSSVQLPNRALRSHHRGPCPRPRVWS